VTCLPGGVSELKPGAAIFVPMPNEPAWQNLHRRDREISTAIGRLCRGKQSI
jgi:hypothetical protein